MSVLATPMYRQRYRQGLEYGKNRQPIVQFQRRVRGTQKCQYELQYPSTFRYTQSIRAVYVRDFERPDPPLLPSPSMRKAPSMFASVTAVAMFAVTAGAQTMKQTAMGKGGSPHVQIEWKLSGANVAIEYGRPFLKGREQAQLMPVGQVWRTGADEATVITTNKPSARSSSHPGATRSTPSPARRSGRSSSASSRSRSSGACRTRRRWRSAERR
jgi:hypothetical protein